ncbi:S1C family serine protease [Rubellimicrobium roseum]|uniref:Serine protease n=1 Tax=Rubellimicrobium roseum TaxID=687525 RepID=A0A5C4N9C2_9RHOB|nr:S1C family serine protease [Rubellimicrobium roseum]TNC66844.1 serine protease [Rubellimicrobium roseum]
MSDLSELSRSLSALAARYAPGVVGVLGARSWSSGFVWREGHVVTADEALDAEGEVAVILPDGTRAPATVAGRDPSTDVALLRVEGTLPPPVPLSPQVPALGELALAVGRGGEGPLAALGLVGAVGPAWRSLRGGTIDARLGLDLRLPRAAEGGLAITAEGQPFGMAVFGPRRSTLVIPATTIERVVSHLAQHGRIGRGYLGLGLQPVRLEGSEERGVIVVSVDADGPGRRADVRQGDVIARWDGEPLRGMRSVMARLGPDSVGRTVELGLLRGGQPLSATLTIGERPAP